MDSLNILFTGPNAIELRREPVPDDPPPGQLLVQTTKSLISTGTECICLQRKFEPGTNWDNWVKYPFHAGYSNVGRVLKVGEGLSGWQAGDRIATFASHRQYHLAAPPECTHIPDGVSDEAAAWSALAFTVQIAVRHAQHELGDTVVLIGLGLLGQLAVQYVRLSGAREIIALDPHARRLEWAAAHGATQTLAVGVEGALEPVRELTEGRLADVVYDITGHPSVFTHAIRLARKLGKVVLLGDTGTPSEQRLSGELVWRGLRVIGAHSSNPPRWGTEHCLWGVWDMVNLFLQFVQRGWMRVDDLITHRFAAAAAPQAYDMLIRDRSEAMGVIFDWPEG